MGLADGPAPTGGEGGHGAAKPESVIHRYRVNAKGADSFHELDSPEANFVRIMT
jgi:hypothetical protein